MSFRVVLTFLIIFSCLYLYLPLPSRASQWDCTVHLMNGCLIRIGHKNMHLLRGRRHCQKGLSLGTGRGQRWRKMTLSLSALLCVLGSPPHRCLKSKEAAPTQHLPSPVFSFPACWLHPKGGAGRGEGQQMFPTV